MDTSDCIWYGKCIKTCPSQCEYYSPLHECDTEKTSRLDTQQSEGRGAGFSEPDDFDSWKLKEMMRCEYDVILW